MAVEITTVLWSGGEEVPWGPYACVSLPRAFPCIDVLDYAPARGTCRERRFHLVEYRSCLDWGLTPPHGRADYREEPEGPREREVRWRKSHV